MFILKVTEPSPVRHSFVFHLSAPPPPGRSVCVECLIGKQKKPIIFKVTEPSVPVILYEITAIQAHVSRGEEHNPFKKGFGRAENDKTPCPELKSLQLGPSDTARLRHETREIDSFRTISCGFEFENPRTRIPIHNPRTRKASGGASSFFRDKSTHPSGLHSLPRREALCCCGRQRSSRLRRLRVGHV